MHYDRTDYEWSVIRPMLPNKPHGAACERPACAEWQLLGLALWRSVARSAGELWTLRLVTIAWWRQAGVWGLLDHGLGRCVNTASGPANLT